MMQPLFDVVLSTLGDSETGEFIIAVEVVKTLDPHNPESLGGKEFEGPGALDSAIEWAKGAVTAFMEGQSVGRQQV